MVIETDKLTKLYGKKTGCRDVSIMDGLMQWGIVISLISPFDVIYRKMIEVVYSSTNISLMFSSPLFLSNKTPSTWMMLYVCVFLATMLILAVRKFDRKDIV